jgi:hypothetical protein
LPTVCRLTAAIALLAVSAFASDEHEHAESDSVDARLQAWLVHPQRTAHAARAATAPELDGNVGVDEWAAAPLQSGFTQRDPDHGEPSTQKTTFQILYDEEALYIGAICYDTQPDSINPVLSRRDEWRERDIFEINLDPHHDHQTGMFFVVGPSGWMRDGTIFNDDDDDRTWDGVWEAKTARRDDGWSVEIKIPYHVLRFGKKPVYTWGINANRHISRHQEWTNWNFIPRGTNGNASRFGHLQGIEGIEPKRSLEILPFSLGRATLTRGEDDGGNETDVLATAGVDVRYGLSSNISLNGAVNPDFGQVEADPAVLNLGVFETFFDERRPFFIEGKQIFESPGPNIVGIDRPTRLYHSRRIGRQPSRFDLPDDSDEAEDADNTTILGAVKISGKTENRTAFGILNAVTGNEYARIDQRLTDPETGRVDTTRRNFKVEPTTNYFVGRVQQDLLTNSTIGAQLTTVNGQGFDPAYVGAGDVHVKWADSVYRIYSRVAASRVGQDEDRESGYEGALYFSMDEKSYGGQAYADIRSRGFNANDLGFMNRNDRTQVGAHMYYEFQEPYWFARRSGFNLNVAQQNNLDGDKIGQGINLNMWHDLHNYWGFWMGLDHNFESYDDLETRGGPPMKSPASSSWAMDVWADDRMAVSGWYGTNVRWGLGGDNLSTWNGLELELKPASNIEIEVNPSFNYDRNDAQWVENVDADGDDEDDRFIFGELKNKVFELGIRGTLAFTPVLSTQLFLQPFVTTGDYGRIKELSRGGSYQFTDYDGLEKNPDFRRRSLRFNLVVRWEYAPGSTIFVVWQQNRDRDFDDIRDPDFEPLADAGRSFTDEGDNIFLVKVNKWMGL